MSHALAKMITRNALEVESLRARAKSADRILEFIADWLEGGTMPFPSTLMPDSEQTLEQAVREHFKLTNGF